MAMLIISPEPLEVHKKIVVDLGLLFECSRHLVPGCFFLLICSVLAAVVGRHDSLHE